MFFNPTLVAKVATAEKFPVLLEMKQAVKEYIEASEEMVWKAAKTEKPTPTPLPHPDTVLPSSQRTGNGFADPIAVDFPTQAPPISYEQGANIDDIPF